MSGVHTITLAYRRDRPNRPHNLAAVAVPSRVLNVVVHVSLVARKIFSGLTRVVWELNAVGEEDEVS